MCVPLLSALLVVVSRVLGIDSIGQRHIGDVGAVSFFSLVFGYPLATVAPLALSRLARRHWSRTRQALVVFVLTSVAVATITFLLYVLFGEARNMLKDPVMPVWIFACAGALTTAFMLAGPAPASEREAPVDGDYLSVRALAFGVVVACGLVILALASV